MPNIGPMELVIVLIIALVVFGPKRLPEMGRQLGRTLREFKSATSDIRSQIGIDDIADSVSDLKSGLSLTSDSPRPPTDAAVGATVGATAGAAVVADAPAPAQTDTVADDLPADLPADAGSTADAAIDGETSTATDEPADESDSTVADEPVDGNALTVADEPVDGGAFTITDEPVDGSPTTITDEPVDGTQVESAAGDSVVVDGDPAATDGAGEGDMGVEAFGSLTRRSASSSARTAAD